MILSAKEFLESFEPSTMTDISQIQSVLNIVKDVRNRGDAAVEEYSERFDGVIPESLEIPAEACKEAYDGLSHELKDAMEIAIRNIEEFQTSIKWKDGDKAELFQKVHPLQRVGIYVPGGKAAYPSSVLHSAVLANVAGVKETIVVTPPQRDGAVNQTVLAACYLTGIKHVYQVGGAQAIAALAYGTETIPAVDKIVGPGNHFVALAKKLVYGDVGIDSIAGPSEIVLVVDETANPEWIALDVMAQAEHDEMARTFVISDNREMLVAIEEALARRIDDQPRAAVIRKSLADNHYSVLTSGPSANAAVTNFIAGEHVSIQTKDADAYIELITTAGALFVGPYAPEAIGDYSAGPSHVLPTSGNARFANGLTVNDFLRTNSVLRVSKDTFRADAPAAMALAKEEGLQAHHDSVAVRYESLVAADD